VVLIRTCVATITTTDHSRNATTNKESIQPVTATSGDMDRVVLISISPSLH